MMQWHRRSWVVGVVLIGVILAMPIISFAATRDLTAMPKVAAGSIPMGGDYWALIVGIDNYKYVPPLETATRDATAVRDVLVERYGFRTDHVTVLLNEQATREGIEEALYRLGKQAGPTDSVFIYYAGHGQVDLESQRGFWVPVEGKAQSPSTFISNALIRDEIAAMKAKHVYLVADSCFSGTLFAKSRSLPPLNDKFFQRLYANKSRWGLTSGQNEPVADQGKNGHSMFAYFFVKLLKENDDPYLVPSHIYDQIAPLVGRNAEQQPRSEPLQGAGDEGGQFVFRLARAGSGTSSSAAMDRTDSLAAERQQLEEERRQLQMEREVAEREKLAVERADVEAERKRLEVARLSPTTPPVELPTKQLDNVLAELTVQALDAAVMRQFGIPSATAGVVISSVSAGSQAEKSMVYRGDVIQEINSETVKNLDEFQKAAAKVKKNELVILLLSRQGYNLFVAVMPK